MALYQAMVTHELGTDVPVERMIGHSTTNIKRAISRVNGGKYKRRGYVREYNSGKIVFQNIIKGL